MQQDGHGNSGGRGKAGGERRRDGGRRPKAEANAGDTKTWTRARYSVVGLVAYSGQGRPAFLQGLCRLPLACLPVHAIPDFAQIATRKFGAEVAAHDATATAQPQSRADRGCAPDPSAPSGADGDAVVEPSVDQRRCSPDNPVGVARRVDEVARSADGIEAFQDSDSHVIYLFLRYPEPELGIVSYEGAYYSLEQQIFHWECQLLQVFLSAHTVLMLSSGARFPAPLLKTLRALQSAKVALFDANVLNVGMSGRGQSAGGGGRKRGAHVRGGAGLPGKGGNTDEVPNDAQNTCGKKVEDAQRVEWIPSLAFVLEPPAALAGAEKKARFEKSMDAQIRQVLDSAGCTGTTYNNTSAGVRPEALFVLRTEKCVYTSHFAARGEGCRSGVASSRAGLSGGSENPLNMTNLLEVFAAAAGGTSGAIMVPGAEWDQSGKIVEEEEELMAFMRGHLESARVLDDAINLGGMLKGGGGGGGGGGRGGSGSDVGLAVSAWCLAYEARLSAIFGEVSNGSEEGGALGIIASSLCGARGLDHRLSTKWCEKAMEESMALYQRDAPGRYTASEHVARKGRACAHLRVATRGPAAPHFSRLFPRLCDDAWHPARRRCDRQSLSGRLCIHAEGHARIDDMNARMQDGADATMLKCDGAVRECDSGVEWLSASGCGRHLRSRRDPFSLFEANHLFYQEFEEQDDMMQPSFVLPLRLEAANSSGPGPNEDIDENGGLVCRVYVLGSREEFMQAGLQVQGCAVPDFAVLAPSKGGQPNPDGNMVDPQHFTAAETQQPASAVACAAGGAAEIGKGSKGRNRAKNKGGAGGGATGPPAGDAVSADELWPSLAPSASTTDGLSSWSGVGGGAKVASSMAGVEEGERVGKGRVAGEFFREREKDRSKPLNPLQDALEAMFLATETSEKVDSLEAAEGSREALALPKDECLIALDFEGRGEGGGIRRMVADGFSVQPTSGTVTEITGAAGSGLVRMGGGSGGGGGGAVTLGAIPLVQRLGVEHGGAIGGLGNHTIDEKCADGEGLGDDGDGCRAAGKEKTDTDLVQLIRVYVVSPDAASGLVVLRPRVRLAEASPSAAPGGLGRARMQTNKGETSTGRGLAADRACTWVADEELCLPPSSLVAIHLPCFYSCKEGVVVRLVCPPSDAAATPGSIHGAWGPSKDRTLEVVAPAVGREVVSGEGSFVGELLDSSLIFYSSS